jgi:hypothetical protein
MSGIATKVKIGTAASAIALAAVFTPAGVAQADPVAPLPQAGLGSAALVEDCPVGGSDCDSPPDLRFAPNFSASLVGPPPNIIQNNLWWFGPANPNPGPRTTIFAFTPLSFIPGFLRPLYGWFTQNLNFEACVAGVSVKVGPYGSVSGSIGSHC